MPPIARFSTRSTICVGITLRSTCRPGAAGPKMVEALLDAKRQPLIRVNVRFVPRPKRLTKLTPTPNEHWPPPGVTPAPKPAISLSASATLVKARKSMYARLTTVAGSKVSNPARRMRDPVTTIVSSSPAASAAAASSAVRGAVAASWAKAGGILTVSRDFACPASGPHGDGQRTAAHMWHASRTRQALEKPLRGRLIRSVCGNAFGDAGQRKVGVPGRVSMASPGPGADTRRCATWAIRSMAGLIQAPGHSKPFQPKTDST